MSLPRRLAGGVAALTLAGALALVPALASDAATTISATHHFANCTAVHKVYSGGIAKSGVKVNTIHHKNGTVTKEKLKGTVRYSTTLYNANKKLDADKDGVACEKS